MKSCFTTLGCPDWSVEEIVACCRENSFEGVELRGLEGEFDLTKVPELEPPRRTEFRERFEEVGTKIACLGTSCRLSVPKDDEFEPLKEQALAHVRLASALWTPYVRVFGGAVPEGEEFSDCALRVARRLDELARSAAEFGVTLLIETHDDFITGERLAIVLENLKEPNIGALWDIHHPFREGEALAETWRYIGEWVRHTHLKDSIKQDDSIQHVRLGEGDIPVVEALRLLQNAGYDGYLSLEWEKAWHPELEDAITVIPHYAKTLKRLLAEIS